VVEKMFKYLAVKKDKQGNAFYVFWDKQCLNDGQNWESGFIHGIQNSQVIVLLISNSTVNEIVTKAAQQQDNVLIEYECALLLNKIYEVPVFPVFLAELGQGHIPSKFDFKTQFPDVPHCRNEVAQRYVGNLRLHVPEFERSFLQSIKKTMAEIFKLNGAFLPHRMENDEEVHRVIDRILAIAENSIPATSRLPMHTLPEYPDTISAIKSTVNPSINVPHSTSNTTTIPTNDKAFLNSGNNLFSTHVVVVTVAVAVIFALVWTIFRK